MNVAKVIALVIVATVSCVPIGSGGGASQESAASVPAYHAAHVIRSLALADPSSGPPEAEDTITQERYVPAGFQIRMKVAERNSRHTVRLSTSESESVVDGLRVEADITFTTGAPAGASLRPYVAISCNSYGATATVGPRYMFALDAIGDALIVRVTGTSVSEFKELSRSATGSVIRPAASNHVQADCLLEPPLGVKDNTLQVAPNTTVVLVLTINGTQLLATVDRNPGNAIPFAAAGFEINSGAQADSAAVFGKFVATQIALGP